MIKYNDDNIYVGYIKQLLHTFNLPCCKIDNPSSKYYVGEYFINDKKNTIYKVLSVGANARPERILKVCDYKFGDFVLNITKNLELRNNYYDTYTHEYLGEYLRFIRDYKGIDLMSMYNCFSNNIPTSLNVDEFNVNNDLYSVYMISVKPNTTYTIALDCHTTINISCGHYAYHNFLDEGLLNKKSFTNLRFNRPITYTTPAEDNLKLEKTFKMFIRVPSTIKSSLVVLEGDYTKSCETICTPSNKDLALDFFEHIDSLAPYIPFNQETLEEGSEWFLNDINTHIGDDFEFSSMSYTDNKHALGLGETYTNEEYQLVKDKIYREYTLNFFKYQNACSDDLICNDNLICGDVVNYKSWKSPKIYLKDILNANYLYLTKSQLLDLSSSEKYLLADRLVEYLSRNAITPDDEVIDNIKKVQIMLAGNKEDKLSFDTYGYWTKEMREWIYRYLNTHQDARGVKLINEYKDMMCYVDKDVESNLKALTLTKQAKERLKELGGEDNAI